MASGLPFPYRVLVQAGQSGVLRSPSGIHPWEAARRPSWRQLGDTGTIPYSMRQHAADFVGAAFDTREGAGDGSRWWYINTWALSWSRERGKK